MRPHLSTLALCTVLMLPACRALSGVPEPFERLFGPPQKESHGVTVAADELALVVDSSGPHPCMIAYDADLGDTEYMAHRIGHIEFAAQGDLAFWASISGAQILVPPDMDEVHSVDLPRFLGGNAVIVPDPNAHRWVVIERTSPKQAVIVDAESGRVTHEWAHEMPYPRAAAIDRDSGLLVIVEERAITLVAPESGERVHRVDLPNEHLGFGAVAAGGRVWIPTADESGDVLEFDVEARAIARRVQIGMPGSVTLTCSPSRTHLAVLVYRYASDAPNPCRIGILRVDPDGLTQLHELSVGLPGVAHDIALMSRAQILLIACGKAGTLAWRYGESE